MHRKFKIPQNFNTKAKKLSDLVELSLVCEPALTRRFSLNELKTMVIEGSFKVEYECHTQVNYNFKDFLFGSITVFVLTLEIIAEWKLLSP